MVKHGGDRLTPWPQVRNILVDPREQAAQAIASALFAQPWGGKGAHQRPGPDGI